MELLIVKAVLVVDYEAGVEATEMLDELVVMLWVRWLFPDTIEEYRDENGGHF